MTEGVLPQDPLAAALHEYKTRPISAEVVDATWQAIWNSWGTTLNHKFAVPTCDRDAAELEELKAQGGGVLLIPDEVMTSDGLLLLSSLRPHGILLPDDAIAILGTNNGVGGCLDIEMDSRTPNLNMKDEEFKRKLEAEKRNSQRLATYLVGSRFNQLLTGEYFDQDRNVSASSRLEGFVVATFHPDGSMIVIPHVDLEITLPHLGWRSEGRKSV